jgi:ABC-type phosphate transport system substrate-binding protein
MLFSGSVTNWNQFNSSFPDEQIVICLRHAGSGTHATLDAAVMRGDWPLVTFEDPTGSFGGPIVYFNDGSSDLMKCVEQNAYAVGYADADQSHGPGSSYANVKSLTYMGETASRENIKNGLYDFWSAQWLYEDPTEPNYAVLHPVVVDLMNYASDPANLPSSKADWWATQNEMQVSKANDFAYPSF